LTNTLQSGRALKPVFEAERDWAGVGISIDVIGVLDALDSNGVGFLRDQRGCRKLEHKEE